MLASLVLLTLAPVAPVPQGPPPVELTARPTVHPGPANVDEGHFIQVTIKNTSKETLSFDSRHELGDLVYVKVTNEKGKEVSESGYHLLMLCSSRSRAIELRPGDSATVVAHLLQDWPHGEANRKPGKYTARVVFTSGKIRAESAVSFELEVLK